MRLVRCAEPIKDARSVLLEGDLTGGELDEQRDASRCRLVALQHAVSQRVEDRAPIWRRQFGPALLDVTFYRHQVCSQVISPRQTELLLAPSRAIFRPSSASLIS